MMRGSILLATLLIASHARAADWDEKWFNPKPAEGDFTLPIPCGGKITFRAVKVPLTATPLSDRAITLGEPNTTLGYLDFQHGDFLAAPFPAGEAAREYYMGKYDLTRDQYAAIVGPDCPEPSPGGRVPMTGVSWVDAVTASAKLSSWWLANVKDRLPKRGDASGFARLPTEEEWEYAARGGAAVSESDFLGRTWPMPEGPQAYIQAGSRMTANRAQQVGQLRPNPLGLYDMLGNVDQMMLEPFRMNRVGRLHGQAGGVVLRGGNFRMTPQDVHTSMRQEAPPFDLRTGAATKDATTGFRLVLTAVSIGSLPETEQAQRSFDAEVNGQQAVPDDPVKLLALLKEQVTTDGARRGLDRIAARLADLGRERADRNRVAMQAQLEAAAALANFIWHLDNFAKVTDRLAEALPAVAQQLRDTAERRRQEIQPALDGYLRLVRGLATSPESAEIEAQSTLVKEEFTERHQAQLFDLLATATRHAAARRDAKPLTREQALQDILAVPARRP